MLYTHQLLKDVFNRDDTNRLACTHTHNSKQQVKNKLGAVCLSRLSSAVLLAHADTAKPQPTKLCTWPPTLQPLTHLAVQSAAPQPAPPYPSHGSQPCS